MTADRRSSSIGKSSTKMPPTLTVYEGDSQREVRGGTSLATLTKQAADALDALVDRMHKRDPFLHAMNTLAEALHNRVDGGRSEWLREKD